MRIIERPEVKGGFVPCIECGVGTRSHVLETAEYEEYEELWEDDDLQEYQGRKKVEEEEEEEDVVIRYRLHNAQVCMCHKCWLPKRKKATAFLIRNKEQWVKNAPSYISRIKSFLKSWNYYGFDDELELAYQEDINSVRTALKNSAGISEEE
mgnify:CR=1 FL=1